MQLTERQHFVFSCSRCLIHCIIYRWDVRTAAFFSRMGGGGVGEERELNKVSFCATDRYFLVSQSWVTGSVNFKESNFISVTRFPKSY